jgi:hypothetical protein
MWSLVWPGNFKVKVFSCEPSNFINQTELGLQWACLVLCWRGPNNMRQASQSLSMEKWNFSSFPAELAEGKIMNPTVQVSAAVQPTKHTMMHAVSLADSCAANQSIFHCIHRVLASFMQATNHTQCVCTAHWSICLDLNYITNIFRLVMPHENALMLLHSPLRLAVSHLRPDWLPGWGYPGTY